MSQCKLEYANIPLNAIENHHQGSKFTFSFECSMENSGEEGKVSITMDGSQKTHELKIDNEAKTQQVAFDVDKHYGSISVKY